MKDETIYSIFESYLNGNISWVKKKIKRMSKADFLTGPPTVFTANDPEAFPD